MDALLVRLRWVLARRGTTLGVVALLIGAVLLGSVGVAYAAPPATTVVEQTAVETFSLSVGTSAVVTGETTLYAPGTRLDESPVYLSDSTPTVTLAATTVVPDGRDVAVDGRLLLVVRAVDDERVFWEERRVLAAESVTTRDGQHVLTADLDVVTLRDTRLAEVRAEVGAAGRVETLVVAESAVDAGQYTDRLAVTVPLGIAADSYEFGTDRSESVTHTTPVERVVPARPDASHQTRLASGSGLAVLGAGLVLYGRRQSTSVDDIDAVRYREWISRGRVDRPLDDPVVLDSLGDLVDVAIDTGKRVVRDADRGLFVVLDGDVAYTYPAVDDQSPTTRNDGASTDESHTGPDDTPADDEDCGAGSDATSTSSAGD
jgi:hypothetical protein